MSTAERPARTTPRLVAGQCLDQATFHELYEAMPPGTRAELVQGVVSMPGPVSPDHSRAHVPLIGWLDQYALATPGVEALDNASLVLDAQGELQPDGLLRIIADCGGQTQADRRFVLGAPELVVEVARSSRYLDLGPKRLEYERGGVREYVVRALEPDELIWHVRHDGRLTSIPPDAEGLHRSEVFPGLWLAPSALLSGDRLAVREALERGLASAEHAAFVAGLAAARRGSG